MGVKFRDRGDENSVNSEIVLASFLVTVKVERSALFRASFVIGRARPSGGGGTSSSSNRGIAEYATRVSVDRYSCRVFRIFCTKVTMHILVFRQVVSQLDTYILLRGFDCRECVV